MFVPGVDTIGTNLRRYDSFGNTALNSRLTVDSFPSMERIVIAIDPAVTSGENADDTGIIVAGLGEDNVFYILRAPGFLR